MGFAFFLATCMNAGSATRFPGFPLDYLENVDVPPHVAKQLGGWDIPLAPNVTMKQCHNIDFTGVRSLHAFTWRSSLFLTSWCIPVARRGSAARLC